MKKKKVLDEADRMFDMGFEPQIMRILANVRPDRQTAMFSATFPPKVELLARKALKKAVAVVVGGRLKVSDTIEQHVEVLEESAKFARLMELVGEWHGKGSVLVFVDRQDAADSLFRKISEAGFYADSLHGGKDQLDRQSTIEDFKTHKTPLLVATSIAARGLDVKELNLVVNFDMPNHIEDYVHRVGRTGRAGKKGVAYTFLRPDEEQYAPALVKILEQAKQNVPQPLSLLANTYKEKKSKGEKVVVGPSGYSGSGFKFNEEEASKKNEELKLHLKALGIEEEEEEANPEEEEDEPTSKKKQEEEEWLKKSDPTIRKVVILFVTHI